MSYSLAAFPNELPSHLMRDVPKGSVIGQLLDGSNIRLAKIEYFKHVASQVTHIDGSHSPQPFDQVCKRVFSEALLVGGRDETKSVRVMEIDGHPATAIETANILSVSYADIDKSKFYHDPSQLLPYQLRHNPLTIHEQILRDKNGEPVHNGTPVQLVTATVQELTGEKKTQEMAILGGRRIVSINGTPVDKIEQKGGSAEGYKVVMIEPLSRGNSIHYPRPVLALAA